jgi:hypothetical protein
MDDCGRISVSVQLTQTFSKRHTFICTRLSTHPPISSPHIYILDPVNIFDGHMAPEAIKQPSRKELYTMIAGYLGTWNQQRLKWRNAPPHWTPPDACATLDSCKMNPPELRDREAWSPVSPSLRFCLLKDPEARPTAERWCIRLLIGVLVSK